MYCCIYSFKIPLPACVPSSQNQLPRKMAANSPPESGCHLERLSSVFDFCMDVVRQLLRGRRVARLPLSVSSFRRLFSALRTAAAGLSSRILSFLLIFSVLSGFFGTCLSHEGGNMQERERDTVTVNGTTKMGIRHFWDGNKLLMKIFPFYEFIARSKRASFSKKIFPNHWMISRVR